MNGDGKLVPFDRARRRMNPAGMAEFAATARRLLREREVSEDVVTRALRETPREQWGRLAERAEWRTSGVLEQLATRADELERDPQEGLAIAELATKIADTLSPDSYPRVVLAHLRAHAWKDRARALSYLARYDDSLRALDRADACLAPIGTLAHDQAIVDFVRSIVLQHLRRFDEAQALLSLCRRVFSDHRDMRLYRKCTLAAGNLFVRRGDYLGAREVLIPLLRDGDLDSLAIARSALGWCAIHLGSADEALEHFTDAARRHRQLDWDLEAVRASYGAGCALLRLGRLDDAIEKLAFARKCFLSRTLVEEAGLSGLEIVEAHMLRDDLEEAKALAATIVQEFTAAHLNRRAVAALAYLNDAIATSSATPEIVRNVHAYINMLKTDPGRDFAAVN
jgi:tetratricopeptide (TPR) repeat protein